TSPAPAAGYDTPSYRENATGYFLELDGMRWFYDHYLRSEADRADPRASPLRATDVRGLPPALVITAEFDPLRDEGEHYAARLREADVPVTLTRYDGMIHGFFGMAPLLDQGKRAVAATALRAALGWAGGARPATRPRSGPLGADGVAATSAAGRPRPRGVLA